MCRVKNDTLFQKPQYCSKASPLLFPSAMTVDQLEVPNGIVKQSYGEYITFRLSSDGNLAHLSRAEYQKIYSIFRNYSLVAMAKKESVNEYKPLNFSRYYLIKNNIKINFPDIKVVFIPRTLYDLIFIQKMLEEYIKEKSLAESNNSFCSEILICNEILNSRWMRSAFLYPGSKIDKIEHFAYTINHIVSEQIFRSPKGLTYQQISGSLEKTVKFIREFGNKFWRNEISFLPAGNFANPAHCQVTARIDSDSAEKLIENCLKLECSIKAHNAFLLYRGGNINKDNIQQVNGTPHSLSYSPSLFAGSMFYLGANSFNYSRRPNNDCYVLIVPASKINSSPFFIHDSDPITELLFQMHHFHPRSKLYNHELLYGSTGMGFLNAKEDIQYLISNDSRELLSKKFHSYMKKAIIVKFGERKE